MVDFTHVHETGDPVAWQNRITLKYEFFQSGNQRMMELRAAPPAPICYSTDGSDPKVAGATYDGPFAVPVSALLVLAYAESDGVFSEVLRVQVPKMGPGNDGPGPVI